MNESKSLAITAEGGLIKVKASNFELITIAVY